MDIPKLYYLIMTKEEIEVFIEALESCLNNIQYDISMAELDPGYDEQCYCELCSECDKYETMLTKIKTMMNNNESE